LRLLLKDEAGLEYWKNKSRRILVAVKSCHRDLNDGCNQAVRDTWGKDLPPCCDLKFFVGNGDSKLLPDEVRIYCPDDFYHLPDKMRGILNWFLGRPEYDYIFLFDTDTYVIVNRWMRTRFWRHDYTGFFTPNHDIGRQYESMTDNRGQKISPFYAYASTHACGLSRKAARPIVQINPISSWYDDVWIGQVLGPLIGPYDFYNSDRITASTLYQGEKAIFHMNSSTLGKGRRSPVAWQYWMHQMPVECR
jgi:hypothetical protein